MNDDVVVLYRAVGPQEFALLAEQGYRRWPPRLPEQPFFYPVANEQYAREIAQKWNVPEKAVGYVIKFQVRKAFMDRYVQHQVGDKYHLEWWIPSEDLEELNANLMGLIEVVGEYH